jgi:hypothetical protein
MRTSTPSLDAGRESGTVAGGMRRLFMAVVVAACGALPATAAAAERTCTGPIGAETVDDDVIVPQGATCALDGTTVEGNVKIERSATLLARMARIDGNVQGENAARVVVESSQVGGSVQVKQGGGAEVRDTRVTGDIQLDANDGSLQHVARNTVGGNVQVMSNRGGVDIRGNTIDGNLQCKENVPPPTGGDNVVRGGEEDQCAALTGGPPAQPPPGGGGSGAATLTDRSLRSRRGAVRVPLSCPSGNACSGRVGIVRRGANLGSAHFNVAAGQRKTIRVTLNRRGRTQLRRNRRLRVTIAITTGSQTVRRSAVVRH